MVDHLSVAFRAPALIFGGIKTSAYFWWYLDQRLGGTALVLNVNGGCEGADAQSRVAKNFKLTFFRDSLIEGRGCAHQSSIREKNGKCLVLTFSFSLLKFASYAFQPKI